MSKDHVVLFRVTEAQKTALLAQADQQGMTLSELVRRAALGLIRPAPIYVPAAATTAGRYDIVWVDPN